MLLLEWLSHKNIMTFYSIHPLSEPIIEQKRLTTGVRDENAGFFQISLTVLRYCFLLDLRDL